MLKHFICPDEERCLISECMARCRMPQRCAPLSYIRMCKDREWNGKPSVTQLLNGTRESFLKITKDHAIHPSEMAWAILGTKSHGNLERNEDYNNMSEIKVEFEGITGTIDEIDNDNGEFIMYDHKVPGSYFVAKMIGMVEEGKKNFILKPEAAENWEYEMQLNMYRIMWEHTASKRISRMYNFVIPRDGDTYMAKSRGINSRLYLVHIPRLNDVEVLGYFTSKRDELLNALKDNKLPAVCRPNEAWGGRKCESYCRVRDVCKAMGG